MRKILSAAKTTTRHLSTNSKPPTFNNLLLPTTTLVGLFTAHEVLDYTKTGGSFCFWKNWDNSSSDTEDLSASIDTTSLKKEMQNENNSNAKEAINVKEMVKHREQLIQKEASENFDIFEHTNRLNNSI